MSFVNFQKLFQRAANKAGLSNTITSSQVCNSARELLQSEYPKLIKHTKVVSFQSGTLKLTATNSNTSQELFYIKTQIQDHINQKYDRQLVSKILIQISQNSFSDY